MKKLWKCKTCRQSCQSKEQLDNHWLSCWEKNKGKKFFDLLGVNNPNLNSKTYRSPMPLSIPKRDILELQKNKTAEIANKFAIKKTSSEKTSPKIKTVLIDAKCSCEGMNENCFKCNGTGFYKSKIITNINECQERIQEKVSQKTNPVQESQFSNDQRGGIYGIRESGRFSSNPLYEEDE